MSKLSKSVKGTRITETLISTLTDRQSAVATYFIFMSKTPTLYSKSINVLEESFGFV